MTTVTFLKIQIWTYIFSTLRSDKKSPPSCTVTSNGTDPNRSPLEPVEVVPPHTQNFTPGPSNAINNKSLAAGQPVNSSPKHHPFMSVNPNHSHIGMSPPGYPMISNPYMPPQPYPNYPMAPFYPSPYQPMAPHYPIAGPFPHVSQLPPNPYLPNMSPYSAVPPPSQPHYQPAASPNQSFLKTSVYSQQTGYNN